MVNVQNAFEVSYPWGETYVIDRIQEPAVAREFGFTLITGDEVSTWFQTHSKDVVKKLKQAVKDGKAWIAGGSNTGVRTPFVLRDATGTVWCTDYANLSANYTLTDGTAIEIAQLEENCTEDETDGTMRWMPIYLK